MWLPQQQSSTPISNIAHYKAELRNSEPKYIFSRKSKPEFSVEGYRRSLVAVQFDAES
jgi:hypothetical protein